MEKKENISLTFANMDPLVVTKGTGLPENYSDQEYAKEAVLTHLESPQLRIKAAKDIFELLASFNIRIPSCLIDNDLTDSDYFKKLKRILFFGMDNDFERFSQIDVKLHCAMWQPWYRHFFNECVEQRLDFEEISRKMQIYLKLHENKSDPTTFFFAEELIFINGILKPFRNMEFNFFLNLKKCQHCGHIFHPKTSRAVFCSDKCRSYAHAVRKGEVKPGSKRNLNP